MANKTKRVLIEITLILISVGIIIMSFLSDFAILPIPSFASLNLLGVEELFISLFTVQASVATVSIAIVSIITGFVNETILGISISGFITNKKPVVLKHNRLIIANLIVTVLNYISVAMAFFNVCIALFIISIVITILLVDEVYVIFLGKNKIRQEIHEFVLENYDAEILNNLNNELLSAIEIGNSLTITENFEIIKKILKAEAIKSDYQSTEIIEQLSKIVCDVFDKTSYKHNGQRTNYCLLQICEIYKIANENEDAPLHLNVWNKIVRDLFRALKDIDFEQHRDDFAYYQLHTQLYKNLKGRSEQEINESNLNYYSSWVYSILISKNSKFKREEQVRIKHDIYQMVYTSLLYRNFNVGEENIKKLLIIEMCNLHKCMIDDGDSEGLKKLFFKHLYYNPKNTQLSLVFTITILYLYYLSSREQLVKGRELQEYAKNILSDNHDAIKRFYYYVDIQKIVIEYMPLIQGLLHNWEYMNEGEIKHVVMYHVIDDFIIFMSLDRYWNHDIIYSIVEQLSDGSMFPLYNRYFCEDDGDSIKNLYSEFNKMFTREKSEELLEEKISILHDVFNKRYKTETIKFGDQERITNEQKENFAKLVIDKVEKVNDELKSFGFKNGDNNLIVEKNDTIIYRGILSNYSFQYDGFEPYVEDDIYIKTLTAFINSFFQNISYKQVTYKEKDKQKTLIQMVEELEITPTVAIGNRDEFWGEEEPDILNKYISNMKRIKYPGGYNFYFILDSSLIEFSMENIRVEYVDLTWEEIMHRCKENDSGELSFNVTNNIYIPFTKSEIEQYITNTEKKMLVYADIKVRLKDKKVGAGIEIVSSLSD